MLSQDTCWAFDVQIVASEITLFATYYVGTCNSKLRESYFQLGSGALKLLLTEIYKLKKQLGVVGN